MQVKTSCFILGAASMIALFSGCRSDVKKKLASPDFSKEAVLDYKAGLRPYRKTGIRLESESYQDKLIIHDYGHGGSGISLSWGSARRSLQVLEEELSKRPPNKEEEIAVLGAGVIGLTTVHLLLEKGWKVHVYASDFPPNTTSNLAPGIWNRVLVESDHMKKILRDSYTDFKALAENKSPRFKGVTPLKIYTFKKIKNSTMAAMPSGTIPKGIPLKATFENGMHKKGMFFHSFLIDSAVYLEDLFEKAQAQGAEFTRLSLGSKKDLEKLPQKIIFNCTGLGSKALFGDKQLIPIRGHLIYLKPTEGFDSMVAGPLKDDLDLYLIPLQDKIVLGGSYEMDIEELQPDSEICEKILKNARLFFTSDPQAWESKENGDREGT
ncbi:MAG: FAD-dependent oxidoreductase [Verrucomicrobia bacterium]|nr:FAD-dependent oxidoreductase [Verrucomicrobiota bacterium]